MCMFLKVLTSQHNYKGISYDSLKKWPWMRRGMYVSTRSWPVLPVGWTVYQWRPWTLSMSSTHLVPRVCPRQPCFPCAVHTNFHTHFSAKYFTIYKVSVKAMLVQKNKKKKKTSNIDVNKIQHRPTKTLQGNTNLIGLLTSKHSVMTQKPQNDTHLDLFSLSCLFGLNKCTFYDS